jgi:hypothetical protein
MKKTKNIIQHKYITTITLAYITYTTLMLDLIIFVLLGAPCILFSYLNRKSKKWIKTKLLFLILWAILLSIFSYKFSYSNCPFELPPTAKNLRAKESGWWLLYNCEVSFKASAEDCLETASKLDEYYTKKYGHKPRDPIVIDKEKNITIDKEKRIHLPQSSMINRASSIKKGVYYPSEGSYSPEMLVDEKKGKFYFRITD